MTPEDVRSAAQYVIDHRFYGGAGAVNGPFGREEPLEWFLCCLLTRLRELKRERAIEWDKTVEAYKNYQPPPIK